MLGLCLKAFEEDLDSTTDFRAFAGLESEPVLL